MTAQTIKSDLESVISTFLTDNSITETTTLTDSQNTDLTDLLATKLETVNPNHDYPPVKK